MNGLDRIFISVGGLAGFAGVVLGALSAHAFRDRIDPGGLASLETASLYLLVHGLLLVVVAGLSGTDPGALALRIAGALAIAGIVLFCGGLTVSVLSGIRSFSAAAPLGGLSFMGAWLCLVVYAISR